jgi:hypothetical protein
MPIKRPREAPELSEEERAQIAADEAHDFDREPEEFEDHTHDGDPSEELVGHPSARPRPTGPPIIPHKLLDAAAGAKAAQMGVNPLPTLPTNVEPARQLHPSVARDFPPQPTFGNAEIGKTLGHDPVDLSAERMLLVKALLRTYDHDGALHPDDRKKAKERIRKTVDLLTREGLFLTLGED